MAYDLNDLRVGFSRTCLLGWREMRCPSALLQSVLLAALLACTRAPRDPLPPSKEPRADEKLHAGSELREDAAPLAAVAPSANAKQAAATAPKEERVTDPCSIARAISARSIARATEHALDFDHDTEPEVYVVGSYAHEGEKDETHRLFTFKHGRIELYAPARTLTFVGLEDKTQDGLPDLLLREQIIGGKSCGSGFSANHPGLTFIAHALPDGTFSLDDAAARQFSRQQCPTLPARISTLRDVLCARLWGSPPEEIAYYVKAHFTAWDCDAEDARRPQQPKAHVDFAPMLSGAESKVPFVLR